MRRKSYLISMSKLSLAVCLLSGYVVNDIAIIKSVSANEHKTNNISPRENLYKAVNGNWLAKTKLKKGQASISSFSEVEEKLQSLLVSDMNKMAIGKIKPTNAEQEKMITYYKQGMDFKTRKEQGMKPLIPFLNQIENVSSMSDFQMLAHDFMIGGFALPFSLTVETNGQDNRQKQLVLRQAPSLLQKPDQYNKGNKEGEVILSSYRKSAITLFKQAGKNDKESRQLVKQALAFDKLLAEKSQVNPSQLTAEADTSAARYHPESMDKVSGYAKEFSFKDLIEKLVGVTDKPINVEDQEYFHNINSVLSSKQLDNMKAWMMVSIMINQADLLGEQNRQAASTFKNATSGLTQMEGKEKNAYTQLEFTFGHILGDYYGKKYFGDQARKDVEHMAQKIISVYQKRLKNNTWLSEDSKAMAIKKLNNMKLMIGYPDDYDNLYRQYQIDSKASFFENTYNYKVLSQKLSFAEFNQPNVRGTWQMSANAVNAYNDPNSNSIFFPAAILQAPFYDKTKSVSQNYGAIGAIIGHEISHSFDINGMKYDENGNLHNWWTKEDVKHYKKKTQAMIDQWDGLKTDGGKVDGQLTLAENITDNGGVMAALEALKTEANPNYKEFFESWACVWHQKSTKEQSKASLQSDVHAPYELRANIPVRNFQEFYDAFGIKKGDPMYLNPEKRLTLW